MRRPRDRCSSRNLKAGPRAGTGDVLFFFSLGFTVEFEQEGQVKHRLKIVSTQSLSLAVSSLTARQTSQIHSLQQKSTVENGLSPRSGDSTTLPLMTHNKRINTP